MKIKFLSSIILATIMTTTVFAGAIKIGFNAPLTGFAAADGKSALNGAKLAVQQINNTGGINGNDLELIVYDDQASPKEAVPIAQKLIEKDKVVAAISGSYSGSTRAAASVFQESGVPYIAAYAVHPDITRAGDYVFRASFMGDVQGRVGAKLIGDSLGLNKVAVITLKNDFGKSLVAGFKSVSNQFGINIVAEYEYSIKDRQFGPIVSSIRNKKPEAIYATGYFFTVGPLVKQLRAAGIAVPIIGQEGYDSQKFIDIAGKASEGIIITTSLDRDSDSMEVQNFISSYEKMYEERVDMVAASAHTAVKVLAQALKNAKSTDRDTVRKAIAETTVTASTGTISFNALGEVKKDAQIQIVKDGNWRHHSVISDSTLLKPADK